MKLLQGSTYFLQAQCRFNYETKLKYQLSCHAFSTIQEGLNPKELLRNSDAVCFDVDSTVINEEGIDVLAAYKGAGSAVAELTKK